MSLIAGAIFVSSLRNLQFLEISIAFLTILVVVYMVVLNWINPLPSEIHTFADLARAWTKSNGGRDTLGEGSEMTHV
jgi:hypothetical protein